MVTTNSNNNFPPASQITGYAIGAGEPETIQEPAKTSGLPAKGSGSAVGEKVIQPKK